VSRRASIAAVVLACALIAGCGGGAGNEPESRPQPVADPADFPEAHGKTLTELRKGLRRRGPVLAPSVLVLTTGENRFGFGLFERDRSQITDASVVVYVARAGGGEAKGPYVARYESLEVKLQFQSRQSAEDPDAARSVYVADIPFDRPGQYEVLGIARVGDRLVAATPAGGPLRVMRPAQDPVPRVGERAPRSHTPTKADAGGDIASIDTRVPPSSMHETDFADVVGRKPIALVFATPQLCQSRVCGPVVDIAQQVKAENEGDAEFIHMEIYRDNMIEKGFRPQVVAWRLPTEPWLFAIDRRARSRLAWREPSARRSWRRPSGRRLATRPRQLPGETEQGGLTCVLRAQWSLAARGSSGRGRSRVSRRVALAAGAGSMTAAAPPGAASVLGPDPVAGGLGRPVPGVRERLTAGRVRADARA
jgi:hypothetical protein